MPFPSVEHQYKPGQQGSVGGHKHLSTTIQEMLEDGTFEDKLHDGRKLKGKPSRLIVRAMIKLAVQGNVKAADWLAKYGYGTKIDLTSDGQPISFVNALPRPVIVVTDGGQDAPARESGDIYKLSDST